ncbi:MAG: glycosyltransferase family 4 protein [Clostridia bacterium]|nr:glycosyltransferase family 4 protein [Clostridia bacterium]
MVIVNIEDYFIPDVGYQINIVPKYLAMFGHKTYIVTSKPEGIVKAAGSFFGADNIEQRDAEYTKATGVQIIRVDLPIKKLIANRVIHGRQLFKAVEALSPDIVFVHGNDTFTGMSYISKAKKLPYALITDSHMLEMATTNKFSKLFRKFYKLFITPKIIKNNITVIRTQDDNYVNKHLGIPLSQAPWISYGSDSLLFYPDEQVKSKFRQENNIGENDFVVVYTGKLDEAKGGKLLAEAFLKKFDSDRNVVLVVVGNTVGEYGKEVEELFSSSENRIIRFPTQKYPDLPKFYQAADLSVFAKQCSLSFYDAQSCGLPVLSEDNNINVDRCSHQNGLNFKSGSVQDFRAKIQSLLSMPRDEYNCMKQNSYNFIKENYDYEKKAREYEMYIQKAFDEFKKRRNK